MSANRPSPLLLHVAMASVSLLFALNYIISKVGLNTFSPLTFAYLRVVGAAIVLNVFLRERNAAPLAPETAGASSGSRSSAW